MGQTGAIQTCGNLEKQASQRYCAREYTPKSSLVYFLIANFAPQAEHLPCAVIFGCSDTSAPHSPHFTIISPPQVYKDY